MSANTHRLRHAGTGRAEDGFTLIEVLVAMIVSVIVIGALTASVIAFSTASAASAGAGQQQSDVLDVLNRTSREVSYSEQILFADDDTLSLLTIEGGENPTCKRYTYRLQGKDLHRYSKDLGGPTCPTLDPGAVYDKPASVPAKGASGYSLKTGELGEDEVVVSNVDVDSTGEMYRYYDTSSQSLNEDGALGASTPKAQVAHDSDRISLVRVKIVADVARRGDTPGSVTLETSASPRSALPTSGRFDDDPTASCPANVSVVPVTAGAEAGIQVTWKPLAGEQLGYDVSVNNALVKSVGTQVGRATLSKAEIEKALGANSYKPGSQYAVSVKMKGAAPDAACTARWYLPQITSATFRAVTMPGGTDGNGNRSEEQTAVSGPNVPDFINWNSQRTPYFRLSWTEPPSGAASLRGYVVVGRQVSDSGTPYGPVRALKPDDKTWTDLGDASAIRPATAAGTATYRGTGTDLNNSLWGARWAFQLITVPKASTGDKLSPVETVRAQPKPVRLTVDADANGSRDSVSARVKAYYANPMHWEVSRCTSPGGTFVCASNYRVVRSGDGGSYNLPNDRSGLVFGTAGRKNQSAGDLTLVDSLAKDNDGTAVGKQSQLGTLYRYGVITYNEAGNGPVYDELTDTSLQAPPDVVSVAGTNTSDGVDTPTWASSRRASSYAVYDSEPGSPSVAASGTSGTTSLAVKPRTRAVQREYSVVASNATGNSPYGAAGHQSRPRKVITQRPLAPTLNVYANNSGSTSVSARFNRTSDVGSANRFCDADATLCQYQLIQHVETVIDPPQTCTKNPADPKDPKKDTGSTCIDPPPYTVVADNTLYDTWAGRAHTQVVVNASQSAGSTYRYQVRSRNPGTGVNAGWSDWAYANSTVTAPPPPPVVPPKTCQELGNCPPPPPPPTPQPNPIGSFEIDGFETDFPSNAFRFNGRGDDYLNGAGRSGQVTSGRVGWTDAPGAAYYTWSRTGGPVNVRTNESVTTWDGMEADKKYDYTIVAHGVDGANLGTVTRNIVVAAPPGHPRYVEAVQQCDANRNNGLRRTDWTVRISADRSAYVNGAIGTKIRKYERNAYEGGARLVGQDTLPLGGGSNQYDDMTAAMRKGGGSSYSEGFWYMFNYTERPQGEYPRYAESYARGFGIYSGNDAAWQGNCFRGVWGPAPMTTLNYPNSYPDITRWDAR